MTEQNLNELAKRVRDYFIKLRGQRGLTISEAAKNFDLPIDLIESIETRPLKVPGSYILRLAQKYGKDVFFEVQQIMTIGMKR